MMGLAKRLIPGFILFGLVMTPFVSMSSGLLTESETISGHGQIVYENKVSWLHIDGSNIVDETGTVVRLRGVNIVLYTPASWWQGKLDQVFNQKLEQLGINVVRLCVNTGTFPAYVSDMDWAISWCRQREIRVIIDCHRICEQPLDYPFPPSIPSGWFENNTAGEEWMQWWESVVKYYKDDPTVFGIGLLNEPQDDAGGSFTLSRWKVRAEECVVRVKAINPNIIPFVSGSWGMPYWSDDQLNDPIPFFQQDPNPNFRYDVVFETHLYPYYVFYDNYEKWGSFQFMQYYLAGDYATGWEKMQQQLEDNLSSPDWTGHWGIFGLDKLPIFVGETGYEPMAENMTLGKFPNAVQMQVMKDLLQWFNKHTLSYTVWVWTNVNPGGGGSMDLITPTGQESWMYQVLKSDLQK